MISVVTALSFIHLISLIISGISAVLLYRSYTKRRNDLIRYFMWFFIAVFVWMAAYFLTLYITTGTFTQSEGWELATSHGFFLIGLAFIARIFARAFVPTKERQIFLTTLIIALLIALGGILLRSGFGDLPVPQINKIIIQVSAVFTIIVLAPAAVLFLRQTVTSQFEGVRIRSGLLGISFLLLLWHGISLVLIPQYGPTPWLIGEALNVVAFSLLFIGILYSPDQNLHTIHEEHVTF